MKKAFLALMLVPPLGGCHPRLDSLTPNSGPSRMLVEVQGRTFLASILWDADTPQQTARPAGFLEAQFFYVPPGAFLGGHNVKLKRSGKFSNIRQFTVTASVPFGALRLDRVSFLYASFQSGNQVNAWLYLPGAKIDSGAEVFINNVAQPTIPHSSLFDKGEPHG